MPEGDTIYRTAIRLRSVMQGQQIVAATCGDRGLDVQSLVAEQVRAVEARGKHLLMFVGSDRVIHSHMGMTGSWHVYRPGETWRKPPHRAALVLSLSHNVVTCFSPKSLELLTRTSLKRHRYLRRLGPDLLNDQLDQTEILRRFRIHQMTALGEAVMNQTIVCGIGNVYKSETLFMQRLNPWTTIGQLEDRQLLELVAAARHLMQHNRHGHPRRTRLGRDGQRLWVYGRQNEPCLVCGQTILMRRQGDLGRSTYWCSQCQGRES